MIVAGLLAVASAAPGRLVGPPLSLEKLTAEADIIFKGTAVSSGPVQDEWFKQSQDFIAQETHFKVISAIKGNKPGGTLRFRHYDRSLSHRAPMLALQLYHFEPGRTYIVFAKEAEQSGVFRQLWADLKSTQDQGVLLCLNDKLVTANTVKEAVWNELTAMLDSVSPGDVTYAISQLDQMSDGRDAFSGTQDFDRKDVLAAIHGFMTDRDSTIARAAIAVIGSHNPYLSDERTLFWLNACFSQVWSSSSGCRFGEIHTEAGSQSMSRSSTIVFGRTVTRAESPARRKYSRFQRSMSCFGARSGSGPPADLTSIFRPPATRNSRVMLLLYMAGSRPWHTAKRSHPSFD